jgi:germination protein M
MNRNQKIGCIGIIASAVLVSGCTAGNTSGSLPIDPPQAVTAGAEADFSAEAPAEQVFQSTLYVRDGDGYIVPLSVKLPYEDHAFAKRTLQYMVKGGPVEELLPEGFSAVLPEGTEVLTINISDMTKTATIDFNKAFENYEEEEERQILEAITWAMTSFPSVEYVQLWVDGRALHEMPVGRTPLHEPLSRKMGINVERAAGVEFSRSTPVTLYFLNQTADHFMYYVPVTRLIHRTNDPAGAAIAELIKGPLDTSKLEAVFLPPEGEVRNTVTVSEGVVSVDFDASLLADGEQLPAEALQAAALALKDLTAAQEVRVTVGGQAAAVMADLKELNSVEL